MATTATKIGRVSINPQGEYSSGTQYQRLDVVTYQGSGYICIQDCQNKPVTNTAYWYLLVSKGDTYEVTEEDLQRIALQIEEDASSLFNQLVAQKTSEFNTNASDKTTAFNNNATSKTSDFDTNATQKTTEFNNNATSKTTDFNSNATQKGVSFDANYDDKVGLFNGNATTKTNNYNDNASAKTTAFNNNATSKTEDFDAHVASYTERLETVEDIEETNTKHIKALEDNFDVDTSSNSNDYTITDSASGYNKGNIKIGDGPEIEQVTTTGINLLNWQLPYIVSSAGNIVISNIPQLEIGENYYFVGKCSDNTNLSVVNCSCVWATSNTQILNVAPRTTFVGQDISNATQFYVYVSSAIAGKTITELMLIKGTYDSSNIPDYEPYSGGYASPSPDWEQDIVVVEGSSNVNVNSKNLWGGFSKTYSTTSAGILFFTNENGVIIANGTATGSARSMASGNASNLGIYKTLRAGTYTISGGTSACSVEVVNLSGSVVATTTSSTTFTLTTADDVFVRILISSGTTVNNVTIKPKLEQGSIATPYTPYRGAQSYPITLPTGMFLGSIGTASNYIYGTRDNWKSHKGFDKYIFTGNESISKNPSSTINQYLLNKTATEMNMETSTDSALCNYYIRTTSTTTDKRFKTGSSYAIQVWDDDFEDITAFKTWLATKYSANNPLYVMYKMATTTDTDITDSTLVSQLNAIADNLQTYKGETIVFTTSNNLEPNIQFDYMVNPLSVIEARLDLLEA